jgi:hypothetical protein
MHTGDSACPRGMLAIVMLEYHGLSVAYWWRAISEVSLSRLFFLLAPKQAILKRKGELS